MNLSQLYPLDRRRLLSALSGRWFVLALLASLWLGVLIQTSDAKNGTPMTMPLTRSGPGRVGGAPIGPAYSKMSGLNVQVDTTWVGNRGYRPVTITVTTAAPSTADTLITIRLKVENWRSVSQAISVEHDFEVPLGSTSTSSTFLVPQYDDWNHLSYEIWVDGAKDEQLSLLGGGASSGSISEVAVGILRGGKPERSRSTRIHARSHGE